MNSSKLLRSLLVAAFIITGTCLSAAAFAQSKSDDSAETKKESKAADGWSTEGMEPQAAVVHQFFAHMTSGDVDAFYEIQSARIQKKMDDFGREKALEMWKKNTLRRARVEQLDPEKLEYEYDADKGEVNVEYDGKRFGGFDVEKTEDGWKVDES